MTNKNAFPATARITCKREFSRVFKEGKRLRYKGVQLVVAPNNTSHARLGLAIAKRFCRKAPLRNTVRRIIRETFRLNPNNLCGLDIVVTLQAPPSTNGGRLNKANFQRVLNKQWQEAPTLWQNSSLQ